MNIKPRHKRRFFWTIITIIGLFFIGIICIPPFINLNKMKPVLEAKLSEQTGVVAKINGNINFSLLMHATIVAHDIQIPNGTIGSVSFSVPLKNIFDLQNADLNKEINVNNANLKITDLFPHNTKHEFDLYNISLTFMDHEYKIVRGTLHNNKFAGQIRTNQHKYDITYDDGEFVIINSNDNLHIRGTLFPDGGASGELNITTNDINKWFEFNNPKISEPVSLSMDFVWDGEYGFDFTNIVANNYTGSITLNPNGFKTLTFKSNNTNLDISFITHDKSLLNKTNMNIDLTGIIKLNQYTFNTFKIIAAGINNTLEINRLTTDNFELVGGTYSNQELFDTKLQINNLPEKFTCDYSGNSKKWGCKTFSYGNMNGKLNVDNGIFYVSVTSIDKMPSNKTIRNLVSKLGNNGTIDFAFSDKSGTMVVTPKQMIPKYKFATNITLKTTDINLEFLPEFMYTVPGTYTLQNNKKTFIPQHKQWMIEVMDKNFIITGENFKQWLPNTDLRFLKTLPYAISGTSIDDNIGDLNIMIGNQLFSGNATKSGITLTTNELNLDNFINPYFKNNYQEQKFLMNHPLAILFDIPINVSVSSDTIILDNQSYNNFVYSLKPNTQIFSISDSSRGHLLSIIEKNKFNYDISIQLNKFKQTNELFSFDVPLNIQNSTITAEINLKTSGQTANDLIYNLTGDVDMTFTGGEITGLGFDKFYASADKLSVLNAEYALASALESGITKIKKLKIQGIYNNGNFETTKPFTLSMRHVDAVGALFINNRVMTGTFEFIMRGTAPKPSSIQMNINESGKRTYSITEIINNLDIGFMRAFIRNHTQF